MPAAVCSVEKEGDGRTVSFAGGEIHARVVVDASGVESRLAGEAGLSAMRHPQDIAWAMEATVQHPGLGEEMFFQYWIGSMAPGWKATFSPAGGDSATLGVFVRGHGQKVQPFFAGFLKLFKAHKAAEYRDIEDMKILSVRRGGDPIAVLPGQIVADSFMVTGGAAGQSGLAYSMRAGEICGTTAARGGGGRRCLPKGVIRIREAMECRVLLGVSPGQIRSGNPARPGRQGGRFSGARPLRKSPHLPRLIAQKGRLRRNKGGPGPAPHHLGSGLASGQRLKRPGKSPFS